MTAILTFCLLGIIGATICAAAPGPISGAFGFKLGDVYEPKSTDHTGGVSETPFGPGLVSYVVTPPEANSLFETYVLTLSEKTHRICFISAQSGSKDGEAGTSAYDQLVNILRAKYGDSRSFTPNSFYAQSGWNRVDLSFNNKVLSLRFTDSQEVTKADNEAKAAAAARNPVTDKGL